MATEIKAPGDYNLAQYNVIIFLGGSIEQDTAVQWQKRVVTTFKKYGQVLILNPRRDQWDPKWVQSKSNKNFRQQVTWELDGQDVANARIYYFDPNTKSPITLLELGHYGPEWKSSYVVCPAGYWRRGNVEIFCERHHIPMYKTLKAATDAIKKDFKLW